MRGWTVAWLALCVSCGEASFGEGPVRSDAPDEIGVDPYASDWSAGSTDDAVRYYVGPAALDLLFVVDNSCNMEEPQEQLIGHFDGLADRMLADGIDFHVGVVSTDMEDPDHSGKLRSFDYDRWIDANAPDPGALFTFMADLGVHGWHEEAGREASFVALQFERDLYNLGFYRPEAALGVVILSDEADYSTNVPITLDDYVDWMDGLKTLDGWARVHTIVGPPGGCGLFAEAGDGYFELSQATDGLMVNICAPDWSAELDAMVDLVPQALLDLDGPIDPAQTRLVADGVDMGSDEWEYLADSFQIRLVTELPYGTPIDVYAVDGETAEL